LKKGVADFSVSKESVTFVGKTKTYGNIPIYFTKSCVVQLFLVILHLKLQILKRQEI
jgi:hypothetical protein